MLPIVFGLVLAVGCVTAESLNVYHRLFVPSQHQYPATWEKRGSIQLSQEGASPTFTPLPTASVELKTWLEQALALNDRAASTALYQVAIRPDSDSEGPIARNFQSVKMVRSTCRNNLTPGWKGNRVLTKRTLVSPLLPL